MGKTFRTTERAYYYPPNGAPRVFVADKDVEIDYELAVRLGLVQPEPAAKKVAPDDVENKKRTASQTKKSAVKDGE